MSACGRSLKQEQLSKKILFFPGGTAFSAFCLEKKLKAIQKRVPNIRDGEGYFVYWVEVSCPLLDSEYAVLEQLLGISSSFPLFSEAEKLETLFWVVPRFGTHSPWSSKAEDIIHNVGLKSVTRIERGIVYRLHSEALTPSMWHSIAEVLHDRMLQSIVKTKEEVLQLFAEHKPRLLRRIDILKEGRSALLSANQTLGLALAPPEMDLLFNYFLNIHRNLTDTEIMMFAQANSEHCRHKIFRGQWTVDGTLQEQTLFEMIQNTYWQAKEGVLSAYHDNAAVMEGFVGQRFFAAESDKTYRFHAEPIHTVMKCETHNHPTAVSPNPGAATGAGGEIRDGAAVGVGAKPKAGLCGYAVSHLLIPGFHQPWEVDYGKPPHLASALEIMLEGPIGAASFNNEYGRPQIAGFFRTFAMGLRGYHKPIMLAGGIGNVRPYHVFKQPIPVGAKLVVLGGPALAIGMGGSSLSSLSAGPDRTALDFASVQRSNPEMQRRCQEVIDACWSMGQSTPILSIHDVGAGGVANAIPELVHAGERGAKIELRNFLTGDASLSPMEIWCNEAQERYVLAICPARLADFVALAERERCPYQVVGEVTESEHLIVEDQLFNNRPVDMSLAVLFGSLPRVSKDATHIPFNPQPFAWKEITLTDAIARVLRFPTVADKTFLITIGDRTVGGLIARDQMVGPWQVPVADVGITFLDFQGHKGEAMALGERPPLALLDPGASARMAIGEAITNIAAADIGELSAIKLSANWMVAANRRGDDAALFDMVKTVGMEFCPALGLAIPVGKDSLSMQTTWEENGEVKNVIAPPSLVVTAFAPVRDVRKTLTPELKTDEGLTDLILIDLGEKKTLGASILAQSYGELGSSGPDISPRLLKDFFQCIQTLNGRDQLLAYHDRSDGGLFVTCVEMAFAGHTGLDLVLEGEAEELLPVLFNEACGAVIQVLRSHREAVLAFLNQNGLLSCVHVLGTLNKEQEIQITWNNTPVYRERLTTLRRLWSETTYQLQALRDNPICAQEEYDNILDEGDPGLSVQLTFPLPDCPPPCPSLLIHKKPTVAILREQGVNGHVEMAAAFDRAGFQCVDVHMTDLLERRQTLENFRGIVACGGFSYGDVLGGGRGWAGTILHNRLLREQFSNFFARKDTFALGVCNGCQLFSQLKDLIDGAEHWPTFVRNHSEQFEARMCLVRCEESSSILFQGMTGSCLPIVTAHGEGKALFASARTLDFCKKNKRVTLSYVDHQGRLTERYPYNPSGSPFGITGLTTQDGRITILMPHPERVFRTAQNSWHPRGWGENSPWMQIFVNARRWATQF